MPTISTPDLAKIRRLVADKLTSVGYTKATINAAAQAIEDFLDSQKAAVSSAIDAATAPETLSAGEKKLLAAGVFLWKYGQDYT